MSKGSTRRPENNDKFRENFDRIFSKENKGPDTKDRDIHKGESGVQDQASETPISFPTESQKGI